MKKKTDEKKEIIFNGIPAAPGIAFGEVFVVNVDELPVNNESITDKEIKGEIAEFEDALRRTGEELGELHKALAAEMGEDHAKILDSHIMILADEMMKEETKELIRAENANAAYAFTRVIDKTLTAFEHMEDQYLKERAEDIKDVKRRVIRNLLGQKTEGIANLRKKAIIVAKTLTPSDTVGFKRKYVLAFVSDTGGRTSHAAIIAKSIGIPAVVGLDQFSSHAKPYDQIIVDGLTGQVILNPTPETVELYKEALQKFKEIEKELLTLKDYAAVTLDNRTIELSGNIEMDEEVENIIEHGARGIGLFRTEYFFMMRGTLPGEEEQYRYYRSIVKKVAPDPVLFRTLDIGGDKIAKWVDDSVENNPFMGWRGIRFTLSRKDIFRTQLRAIFRAAAHGRARIMFPMVSVVDEVRQAIAICDEVKDDLKRERYQYGDDVEIGIMIETPSAVVMADVLAREVDFFSIGSNDLVQYSLAVDRGNSRISYLYDTLHPAILRFINSTVTEAHKAGIWVGLCGEMVADARVIGTILLIGLGLDEFSASAYLIPEIKKIIRSVTYDETRSLVRKALLMSTSGEVIELVNRFIEDKRPELLEYIPKDPITEKR
ncbi:MAG: phosphoenolpyruvate--protein phosphotransferase [Candidatus Krumholzibacteriota bacterium]|nr:phosphoenolpyruvate--protein phosphotransferase [Candidatus Krumholzibacteriota bacterium]